MKGIYVAACITTGAALGIFGTIAWTMKKPVDRRWLARLLGKQSELYHDDECGMMN
jgi:hypothetical protein